jgi:hypothetical protein
VPSAGCNAEFLGSAKSTALQKLPFHHSPNRHSLLATHCRFAIRYSPFTIRCLFTSRQSLFAIRCRFSRPADLPTSRFA